MKISITALLLVLANFAGYTQIKPLAIGDGVPDMVIGDIINYRSPNIRLSDFKGKLLVLDFWATWCSPCISMFPKTDSLQKLFKGKVEFLPVSYQDRNTVESFLKKLNVNKGITVPTVTNDKQLHALFPHMEIPYYVWINGKGKVVAMTEAKEITKENIENILDDDQRTIKNSIGILEKNVNKANPVFITGIPIIGTDSANINIIPLEQDDILVQSVAAKFIPGISGGAYNNTNHFLVMNYSVMNMYQFFFGITSKPNTLAFWNKNRYVIEVKDSLKRNRLINYTSGLEYNNWLRANGYCYELIWKNVKGWDRKIELVRDDLDRLFAKPLGITAVLEKRKVPSSILAMKGNGSKLVTAGGESFEKHDAYSYSQRNLPLSRLVSQLEYFWQKSGTNVVNETQYKKNVDIELNCKMSDIKAVNKELAKYGLAFIEGERSIDILVIKDR
ncbi:TlpA family protein disulfide reductase [Chryseobacterium sp. MEBOG07]|uniref:TlpA family protein disulfide reductase n=1 Tax=Chryseobacterium sp. MEBOG07 TaxID=2879939 RepID=UPI001F242CD0|nr:TlpA disulfide reductase family protein [Chryseobacterium sp. MEBOG07]UKB78574.1 TlpA family protein disulfide reductase [Chryseobacterium sp. MEBOG07]